jgi:hypothetical protein
MQTEPTVINGKLYKNDAGTSFILMFTGFERSNTNMEYVEFLAFEEGRQNPAGTGFSSLPYEEWVKLPAARIELKVL